jgi:hypothetical protein
MVEWLGFVNLRRLYWGGLTWDSVDRIKVCKHCGARKHD